MKSINYTVKGYKPICITTTEPHDNLSQVIRALKSNLKEHLSFKDSSNKDRYILMNVKILVVRKEQCGTQIDKFYGYATIAKKCKKKSKDVKTI